MRGAVVNTTIVAGENLTVGSTIRLPSDSGRLPDDVVKRQAGAAGLEPSGSRERLRRFVEALSERFDDVQLHGFESPLRSGIECAPASWSWPTPVVSASSPRLTASNAPPSKSVPIANPQSAASREYVT